MEEADLDLMLESIREKFERLSKEQEESTAHRINGQNAHLLSI